MNKELMNNIFFDDYLECFGSLDINNPICKKFCVLNLRCAIARDKNIRMEIFEDLTSYDSMSTKIQ
jgi:hypothetical protein